MDLPVATSWSRRARSSGVTRGSLALGAVAFVTAVLVANDATFEVASLLLVVVVVLASLLGYVAGTTATVGSYLALNYFFTDPERSLRITKADDLLPLLAFAVAAVAVGTIVTRMDVLRRRALEREREARDARQRAAVEEERAGFLSAMTHNLRTPLGAIKAAVTLLAVPDATISDAERTELLEVAFDETDRLERLVTKVLELSRIRAGFLRADREVVDVADLIRDAVRRLRHLVTDREVVLEVAAGVPLVRVDPAMMEVVLVSLLENALRFAPSGSTVTVAVDRDVLDGVTFRVVDHGPGVAPSDRTRLFEAFERGVDAGDGTGLGLAIALALVEAHAGSIAISDTSGGGATFTVDLPGSAAT